MSKSSLFEEVGMSPFEENIYEKCYDKDESDNKAHLSTTDIVSLEGIDRRDYGYIKDLKCGDFRSSVGKMFTTYDVFPSLRSHILMYLKNYFFEIPGPCNYDYYVELIYDQFRAEKFTLKAEGKWNVKGLLEFLSRSDLQEYLQTLKEPPPVSRAKKCDPAFLKEYEEYLCNISHGMTLEEYRDLNKRDEKDNTSKKNSKKKKKKGSRWKRFLSCLNCFRCLKSQDESQVI